MQPDETEACIQYMFPTDALQAEYSGVISYARQIAEINRGNAERLQAAVDGGVRLSLTAGYNKACVPMYASSATQSDSTLESALMLGGATVANVGETLGDDYEAADPALLSPDRVIDLSTALFPHYAWAFKDCGHVVAKTGSDLTNFQFALLEADEQPTPESMGVPQFVRVDKNLNFIDFE